MAQIEYFDAAILAVTTHSEQLVAASERIAGDAKRRIEANETDTRTRMQAAAATGGLSAGDAQELVNTVASAREVTVTEQARLDARVQEIREWTEALEDFLVKMTDIQRALDA